MSKQNYHPYPIRQVFIYNCKLPLKSDKERNLISLLELLTMEGTHRADVKPGIAVLVELSEDKRSGKLTGGRVKEILTSAPIHPHGIKVVLENGLIGRIKQII